MNFVAPLAMELFRTVRSITVQFLVMRITFVISALRAWQSQFGLNTGRWHARQRLYRAFGPKRLYPAFGPKMCRAVAPRQHYYTFDIHMNVHRSFRQRRATSPAMIESNLRTLF